MTLSEKLQSSEIIASKDVTFKYLHISNSDKRLLSLLSVILITLYTVYTKLILNNIYVLDMVVFFTLLNIATSISVKFICHSTYALNHYMLYSIIFFISKLCKVAIFGFSLIDYMQYFQKSGNEDFILELINDIQSLNYKAFLNYSSTEYSFIFSIVILIPTVIYFFTICRKLIINFIKIAFVSIIPIFNVIYYFTWLFMKNPYFLYYHISTENPELISIEKRKIFEHKLESKVGIKFIISLPLLILVFLLYYYAIQGINGQI